ncbi:hypothetical protein [Desulfovibrio sp. TomC]|uniref:hypothetical protein n=1 Tax=Desulfovibrio sp. TomC TaxID=1562888 RepID=UPI0005758639|nr:hypothetical protein [Desulfovibrio sp. TomC]KHK02790.1 Phage protein [Desulfovibrio sp. TomC]
MATGLLCWPNYADQAAFAGGVWQTPLVNLRDRFLTRVARTAGLSLEATRFDVDLSRDRTIKVVAIPSHTLSPSARIRIRCFADAARTILRADSGWSDVWPPVYATAELEWEADNWWSGRVLPEDVARMSKTFLHLLPRQVFCRYLSVDIDDQANPAGYIDLSRLVVVPGWQPNFNFSYGVSLAWESATLTEASLSGAEHFEERPPYRVVSFRLDYMDRIEATNQALAMTRALDISGEVFFVFDPANPLLMQQRSFLGRLRQLSPLEHVACNINGMAFEIKEVVA